MKLTHAANTLRRGLSALVLLILGVAFVISLGGNARRSERQNDVFRVVVGLTPPNITTSGTGKETDFIREELRRAGVDVDVQFYVVPFGRHWSEFVRDQRFDAVATVPDSLEMQGFQSEPYISYENGITYLAETFPDGLGDEPMKTLQGYRVVAFPGASSILPKLDEARNGFSMYVERAYQYSHAVMLLTGYADAIVADRAITDFYLQRALERSGKRAEYQFEAVFPPTPYRMVFRSETLRDAFNAENFAQAEQAGGME